MSNAFIASFNELLSAQNEAIGEALTASIGGITTGVIIEVPDTAQGLTADAFTEDGGTWVQCLVSPFASRPIKFQTPVIMGERKLQVMNVPESNHGIYRFQVGDPTRR